MTRLANVRKVKLEDTGLIRVVCGREEEMLLSQMRSCRACFGTEDSGINGKVQMEVMLAGRWIHRTPDSEYTLAGFKLHNEGWWELPYRTVRYLRLAIADLWRVLKRKLLKLEMMKLIKNSLCWSLKEMSDKVTYFPGKPAFCWVLRGHTRLTFVHLP